MRFTISMKRDMLSRQVISGPARRPMSNRGPHVTSITRRVSCSLSARLMIEVGSSSSCHDQSVREPVLFLLDRIAIAPRSSSIVTRSGASKARGLSRITLIAISCERWRRDERPWKDSLDGVQNRAKMVVGQTVLRRKQQPFHQLLLNSSPPHPPSFTLEVWFFGRCYEWQSADERERRRRRGLHEQGRETEEAREEQVRRVVGYL